MRTKSIFFILFLSVFLFSACTTNSAENSINKTTTTSTVSNIPTWVATDATQVSEDGVLNTIYCDSLSSIYNALSNAVAGDKIVIAPGTYQGYSTESSNYTTNSGTSTACFVITASGTKSNPIIITTQSSSDTVILKGEGQGYWPDDTSNQYPYVFYITGDYVTIQNIQLTNGSKALILDNSNYSVVNNIEVYDIGDEGIHIRDGSTNVTVENCYVHDTGTVRSKYGEGIYVGSDYKKWTDEGGKYVKECDYAQILNNYIGPNVTAEHIDYKEGASYLTVSGNIFDAKGMCDTANGGTSFMDLKGNNAKIYANTGYQNNNSNEYVKNAFEIHDKYEGWGNNNSIYNNTVYFCDDNTSAYITYVGDTSSVTGSPTGNKSYDNTRSPSNGNYTNID